MNAPLRAAASPSTLASPRPLPAEWTRRAACRHWPELDWVDPTPEQARQCRALCAGCPVQSNCLAVALVTAEPWGIWGGLDVDERAEVAWRYGLPAPRVLPATVCGPATSGTAAAVVRAATPTRYERERRRAVRQRAAQHDAAGQGAVRRRGRQCRAPGQAT